MTDKKKQNAQPTNTSKVPMASKETFDQLRKIREQNKQALRYLETR